MALQAASTATASYVTHSYDTIYNSLTFADVDAEITRVRATSKCATFHLNMQLDNGIHKIKQADDSLLDTTEIKEALEAKGYHCNLLNNGELIELGIFWD